MEITELLNAYREVQAKNKGMRPMTMGAVRIEPKLETERDRVAEALRDFKPVEGWIGFQSANRAFTGGELPADDSKDGVILSAECVDAEGRSLHIRQDGGGGWWITRHYPGEGERHLQDEARQVAYDPKLGWVRYRRYWRIDAEQGAVPFAAAFIGFEPGEEGEHHGA